MFEQTFKNIDDVLWKEAGCSSELDYTEQSSWLLFLKYLDGLEQDKAMEAELEGKKYTFILDAPYRWDTWAAPKGEDGQIDHNKALTGDDLYDFVDGKLFFYLTGFKQRASGPNTIEYKIGEIFGEIKNKIQSGYNLREIIDRVDELSFRSQAEKYELSHLYEAKIKNMGNAGRNGGEYYTPRPLIRAIVQVVKPKIGNRIYDGAVGSAGFLCEAFDFLKDQPKLTTAKLKKLQESTFYGKEKKSLAYVIAIMNMILHGIETPNIIHTNTLTENLADIQEKDRFDIILTNPPFGGKERKEVQQNFPIRTGETAFLFLQHFIKMLKAGGRAGVVIKNTFLSNTDKASVSLRQLLLESCNLHTVLDCPGGTFQGAGVKTVILFFEKGAPTRKVWFYKLDPGRNLGKTNPLNDEDLAEFVELQKTFADSPKSWSIDATGIDQKTFDLSVKNPNNKEEIILRSPEEIMDEITTLDAESAKVLENIRGALMKGEWQTKTLGEVLQKTETINPTKFPKKEFVYIDVSSVSNTTFQIEQPKPLMGKNAPSRARRLVKAKDVLFATVRPTLQRIAIVPDHLDNQVCSTGYFVLRSKEGLDHRFLFYSLFTECFIRQMEKLQKGASYPAVNDGEVRAQELSIPPLPEQKRIIDILDKAFEGIATAKANAEKNLQNARALFESHLQSVFTYRGKRWVEKTLGDVCTLIGGSQPPKAVFSKTQTADNVRLIQIRDYKSDKHLVFIPRSKAKRFCMADDIMIGRYGPPIFQILRGLEGAYNVALMKAVPEESKLSRDFLFYFLKHPAIQQYVIFNSERAAGQSGLNKGTLEPYPIAYPSLDEQVKVTGVISELESAVEHLSSIYQSKIAALDELKKSILHQAFTGQL